MSHPLGFDDSVAYLLGELSPAHEEELEAHLFACEPCTLAVEQAQSLLGGLGAMTPWVVTRDKLAELRDAGVRLRETVVARDGDVDVFFTPDVDMLIHVLTADVQAGERVDLELVEHDVAIFTMEAVPAEAGGVHVACRRHFSGTGTDIHFRVRRSGGGSVLGDYLVRHHW